MNIACESIRPTALGNNIFFTASQILSRLKQKRLKSFSVLRYHADYQRNDAPAPTLSPKRDMRLRKTSLKHSSMRHGFSQCGIPPWWVPLSLGFEKCSFGRFHSATSPPASREEKDMCKVICTVHSRKERGFSTLNAHGFEALKKAAVIKSCRPKGGYIQVICYPASQETVDIAGFSK